MRCSECREILFSIAEEAADKADKMSEKVTEGKTPEAFLLPEEVQQHLEKCGACASLAEALRLTSEETALQVEAPAGLAERVAVSVIDQPKVITHSFGLKRAASLAAAAVLLVAVSVTVTLMLSGNGTGVDGAPGGAVAENTTQGNAGRNAVQESTAAEKTPKQEGQKEQEVVSIHLTLEAPKAESVSVVGDWNDWNPGRHRMTDKNGDGIWELQLKVERGEEYKYQFLVNGEKWIPDPKAPLQVEDGFGGTNSILNI